MAGAIAGGGILLAAMLALATVAIGLGWIQPGHDGEVDLRRWLMVQLVGGVAASALGGFVSRRVARSDRGPRLLAGAVLVFGVFEGAVLIRFGAGGPVWLLMLAPIAGAAAVLGGGWRPRGRRFEPLARAARPRGGVLGYAAPLGVLAAATAISLFALPRLTESGARVASAALALDFTVTAPVLVGLLLVRTRRVPWLALVPTFALGYALAVTTLPSRHHGALDALRWVIVPAEAFVICYLALAARRAFRAAAGSDDDFVTRFRSAARRVLGNRVAADILTTEVALFHHALRLPRRAVAHQGFTVHREVGYASVLVGLLLLLVVETIALHALASRWGAWASWTLTGLSVYAVLWLIGDYRAMSARPTLIRGSRMLLRVGLRWEAEIPIGWIEALDVPRSTDEPAPGAARLALLGQPNLRIRLAEPVELTGMYGLRRHSREIWLRIDDVAEFRSALQRMTGRPLSDSLEGN